MTIGLQKNVTAVKITENKILCIFCTQGVAKHFATLALHFLLNIFNVKITLY